jgi:hypothetical protein
VRAVVRLPVVSSLLVAGLAFAHFQAHPLTIGRADESHLLYAAKRVLQGQVLYEDFFESLTPLGPYFFAAVYAVAGTTLGAARVAIAVIEAVGCALLFHLVRRTASAAEAALAALVFAGVCIPTWPYASPHWISTVLALAVATVALAERWRASQRARPLAAGVLAGVAFCVQQQRGAFLALWLPLALWVLAPGRGRALRLAAFAPAAWAVGGTALVTAVVLGHAAWMSSPLTVADMLFGYAFKHYGPVHSGRTPWAAVMPLTEMHARATWTWLLRVAPLFVAGEGLLLLWRARAGRDGADAERRALCLLALMMGLSVLYLPDYIHVSFVLPFLLLPAAALLHRLRLALAARAPSWRHAVTAAVLCAAVGVAAKGAANLRAARAAAPVRLETGFGPIEVDRFMARVYHAVRGRLVREADGRSLLYSYPDDAWLYLVLPADDPTPYSILAPPMFPPESVREVSEILRARVPGTVVLWTPFAAPGSPIRSAVEEGYDAVQDVGGQRIYVRRAGSG